MATKKAKKPKKQSEKLSWQCSWCGNWHDLHEEFLVSVCPSCRQTLKDRLAKVPIPGVYLLAAPGDSSYGTDLVAVRRIERVEELEEACLHYRTAVYLGPPGSMVYERTSKW